MTQPEFRKIKRFNPETFAVEEHLVEVGQVEVEATAKPAPKPVEKAAKKPDQKKRRRVLRKKSK